MSRHRTLLITFMAVAMSLSALAVLNARAQRIQQALSASFPDLSTVKTVEVKDAGGQVLLTGTFSTTSDSPNEVERTAELTAPAGGKARGKAEIEIARSQGVAVKDEIEMTAQGLRPTMTHTLQVDGHQAITFTTTSKGQVDLKLSRKISATR